MQRSEDVSMLRYTYISYILLCILRSNIHCLRWCYLTTRESTLEMHAKSAWKSSCIMSVTLVRFQPNPKWMENGSNENQFSGSLAGTCGDRQTWRSGLSRAGRETQRSGLLGAERHAKKQVVKCGETHGEAGCHVRRDRHGKAGCHVRRETRRSGYAERQRNG